MGFIRRHPELVTTLALCFLFQPPLWVWAPGLIAIPIALYNEMRRAD